MASLTYHPSDAALAARIEADLSSLDLPGHIAVLVLSPEAEDDPEIQAAILRLVEQQQRIVPVLAKVVPLPKLIEHLEPLDFSQGYDHDALMASLEEAGEELPLRVRTPDVISANRRLAAVFALLAVLVFVIALYAVGVLGIQAPVDEYATVDAEVVETRNAIIDEVLPRSTEDAANFEATFERAAPTLRPILELTVTAQAGQ